MKSWIRAAGLLGLVVGAGCSGGGGGGDSVSGGPNGDVQISRFCRTMAPRESTACSGLTGTLDDCPLVFDGDLDSGASQGADSIEYTGTGGLQDGGTVAGVHFNSPSTGQVSVQVSTLKDGVVQETMAAAAVRNFDAASDTGCSGSGAYCTWSNGGPSYVGFDTLLPFDAIRATIQLTGTETILIRELCLK